MAPHRDIQLNTLGALKLKEESLAHGSSYSMREPDYDDILSPKRFRQFLDGFKREPTSNFFPNDHLSQLESGAGREHDGSHYYDLRLAALENAHSALARKLKGRHLQMIAIGGSIGASLPSACVANPSPVPWGTSFADIAFPGTGLFVASGKSLAAGGPASLLLAFSIIGAMLYCTCQALGELAVIFPIAGSFSSWATRFLDPSWGFAMGWKYVSPNLVQRLDQGRLGADSFPAMPCNG